MRAPTPSFGLGSAALVSLALLAVGCSDSGEDPSSSSGGKPPADAADNTLPEGLTLPVVPCRYVVPKSAEGTAFFCGDLSVPENRRKEGSRSIKLHVIVFKGKKAGFPTIFLEGGPGGSAEESAMGVAIQDPSFMARNQKFLDEGDLVFFDQRGVGRSVPRLTCVPESKNSSDPDPAATCFARHQKAGVDFAGYDSASSADDVHDLRIALGVKKANVHGISYGSRLGLEVLRRHPDDVHAAIVDGVLPPQTKVFTETMPNFDATITKIFGACAADAKCNAAYPNLDASFTQLKAKLDATPFGSLDWNELVATVFDTLYSPAAAGQLPYFIHTLLKQTEAEFNADQSAKSAKSAKEEKARTDALKATPLGKEVYDRLEKGGEGALHAEIASDLAFGMYAAVSCADSGQYESRDEALAALSQVRPELRAYGEAEARSAFAGCRTLPSIAPKADDVVVPIASPVPTLVIGGEVDPITPSKNAELAQSTLSAGQLVIIKGGAHGQNDACGTEMKAQFALLAKPVDAACANALKLDFYYEGQGFAGPGGVSGKSFHSASPAFARQTNGKTLTQVTPSRSFAKPFDWARRR